MTRSLIACLVAAISTLGAVGTARADVIELAASADTSLFAEDGMRSGGGDDGLFVGTTNDGFERRSLLRFDVAAAMPAGSTITAVTLTLNVDLSRGANFDAALHPLSAAWLEGTVVGSGSGGGQGGAAATGDTTWTHRNFNAVAWTTPGGDFAATATATASLPASGAASWASAAMVTDLQSWLDSPATNFGWIMLGATTSDRQARRMTSREALTNQPQLTITFTPPANSGACCGDGVCTVVADPGTGCAGDYQGLDVACTTDLCPTPTGACCLPTAQASCQIETELDCSTLGGIYQGDNQACAAQLCPVVLEPFVDALPIPRAAVPQTGESGGEATYRMSAVQLQQKLHRDLPPTTVWGYDDGSGGSYPGPTIEASSDAPIVVDWVNDLRDAAGELLQEHALPVDTCPHGADDQSARTVVHLHGGHVAARYDGYPEDTLLPGEEASYDYPNQQSAATLWYHDHALGITRLNVYMGLAGFYLIRDAVEAALNLPSGEYDVPLVIQDRSFNADGSLRYPVGWDGHVVHDTIVVNGMVWPFLEVDKGKYRFRILNGSGTRTYRLKLSDGSTFRLIGSDGGLLPAPLTVLEVVIAPGERVEIVIDFRNYLGGSELILKNDAPSPFPGTEGQGVVPDVMKFVVGFESGALTPLPLALRDVDPLPQDDVAETRDFVLAQAPDPCSGGNKWLINGLGWDDITERPKLGTTEIWRFINDSGMMHPMHMHLVFFQVLDKQAFEIVDGVVTPVGEPIPLAVHEGGWQDTVQVAPGEMVRVIAKFEDFTGKFAYHCHTLEHEDNEMMRQFETFTECGDGAVGRPDEECDDGAESASCDADCTQALCGDAVSNALAGEECDDGNTAAGDGCDSACQIEPEPEIVPPKKDDGGCGCGASSPAGGAASLVLVLGALWLGRRRRCSRRD